jgi:membrane associated rhomboid family serine protease
MTDAPPVCYRHPGRPTRISCSECGKSICPECTHDAAVGQKCPECAAPQHRTRVIAARDTWRVGLATTPVTVLLIAANIAIYLLGRGSVDAERWLVENLALIKLIAADEWWRTITAAFLHGSLFHVGVNMYILYLLGPQMERQTGSVTFAALYLAAAAAGGAVSVLTGPAITGGIPVISIGASGAIFGLVGAWFSASYRHRHTPAGRAMFNQMLLWVGISALFPFMIGNIDWRAHLGGLIAGVVIHQGWTRLAPTRPDAARMRTLIAVAVLGLALAATAFL